MTLLLYSLATGVRSSRAMERHCRENVAYRVISGNLAPDHVTITRFVCRHEQALSGLFTDVLKLCHKAGLVKSWGGLDRRHADRWFGQPGRQHEV